MRLGKDMLTAVEAVEESLGLAEVVPGVAGVPSAADNDRALAELSRMMGGIS